MVTGGIIRGRTFSIQYLIQCVINMFDPVFLEEMAHLIV